MERGSRAPKYRNKEDANWRARSRRRAQKRREETMLLPMVAAALERNSGRKAIREGKPLALALQRAYIEVTHAQVAA